LKGDLPVNSQQTTWSKSGYIPGITSSGNWDEDFEIKPYQIVGKNKHIYATEWSKFLPIHSYTSDIDQSFEKELYEILSSISSSMGLFPQRRINIFEAKALAIDILMQAEKERIEIADLEAGRGIDWEE
jgi:hypothetical protein